MSETRAQPSEEEMRAAYEAELDRITSTEMILQTVVSLVNIGGRRLGLAGSPDAPRDLDQVADAIDGARSLMPILERRIPRDVAPLRDAIAQLQVAYAREVRAAGSAPPAGPDATMAEGPAPSQQPQSTPEDADGGQAQRRPGPAESSGRLWVPGR